MTKPLADKKVLVVDDEPDLCGILEYEFTKSGATAFKASGLKDAIALLNRQQVDIIVSDVRMPDGSGIELLAHVRQSQASWPVFVLLSGFSDLSDAEAYELGADVVSPKPFSRKELLAKIQQACERRALRR